MNRSILVVVTALATAASAAAQSRIPVAGLAAEGEGRWTDALAIYRGQVERDAAGAAELWLRIADIEARLSHADGAILALQRAAAARPGDANILSRLSQAHAAKGDGAAALQAIKGALALQPEVETYLRAAVTIATWVGDYTTAAHAYESLRRTHPQEPELLLGMARVNAWGGQSDAATEAYRKYLATDGAVPEAWLELARVESWRGNTVGALDALELYHRRGNDRAAYLRERALVLARGGRPRQALQELAPLLAAAPDDPVLTLARVIALAGARQHGEAATTLNLLRSRGSADETRVAGGIVRSALGTAIGPAATVYGDSDGLRITRAAPTADVAFPSTNTRVHAGYEQVELSAPAGSGLEAVSGATSGSIHETWAGLSQRFGALTVGGSVGQARTDADRLTSYSTKVRFVPNDSISLGLERSVGFVAVSPRSVTLGLTQLAHRAQIEWTPPSRFHLAVESRYDELSDANTRWELSVSPRAVLARTQRVNLDIGAQIYQLRVEKDLDHGYYDPRLYELYSVVLAPYWKVSENVGLSLSAGIGPQRDSASRNFSLGMNAAGEATFGIYREWLLKVHGSATNNRRVGSGAFRGTSGGVVLMRRF